MNLRTVAGGVLDAWNRRDLDAITTTVGAFQDPDLDEPVSGSALRRHVTTFLRSWPNSRFVPRRIVGDSEHAVVCWDLETGTAARLRGVDELAAAGSRVVLTRTFDRAALAATARPEAGAAAFEATPAGRMAGREDGTSARFATGRTQPAGALALTRLSVRDGAESAAVDQLSVAIFAALRAGKGFLGAVTADLGGEKFTLSAFTDVVAARAIRGRQHQRAVRRFFHGDLGVRSVSSVWTPIAVHEHVRCPGCARVHAMPADGPTCACGAPLPIGPLI